MQYHSLMLSMLSEAYEQDTDSLKIIQREQSSIDTWLWEQEQRKGAQTDTRDETLNININTSNEQIRSIFDDIDI